MEALGCFMQYPMLIDLAQTTQKDAEDSRQPDHYQGEAIEPDDHFSPDMDIDLGTSDAMTRAGAYLGMDPNISDSEMDHSGLSGAGSGFVGSDSDSDDEAEAELHPALVPSSIRHPDTSDPSSFSEREPAGVSSDEGDDFGTGADLPEVVRRLRTQLLSGYTPPNHPCYVPSGRINPTWIWDWFAEYTRRRSSVSRKAKDDDGEVEYDEGGVGNVHDL
ncbi:hypothetical protein EDB83DRAFT_2676526 [Lactarius deliciosus]|nr:hypothetical protein EDB83DRAFT_2676526 [Lactarius deliciosus]